MNFTSGQYFLFFFSQIKFLRNFAWGAAFTYLLKGYIKLNYIDIETVTIIVNQ